MMANPDGVGTASLGENHPIFGLVSNGDEFRFIKLLKQSPTNPQFDLSDVFTLLPPQRSKLHQVLQVLKLIGNLVP